MSWPNITITASAVDTPRDSYQLSHISVASVRRPLLLLGVSWTVLGSAFLWRFQDLLYPSETLTIVGAILGMAICGLCLGHLQILSRDLRGSELASVAWGPVWRLNRIRRRIMSARDSIEPEQVP